MIGLDFIYRPNGQSLEAYISQVERNLNPSRINLEARLEQHLRWCVEQVPMYAGVARKDESAVDWLKRFPIFDKKTHRVPNAYTRSGITFSGERLDTTSGTSGVSFQFLTTANERSIRKAYEIVANRLLGFDIKDRHVVLWGGHESVALVSRLKARLFDFLSARSLIVVSGADPSSLEKSIKVIQNNMGGVLITYPSMFRGLVEDLDLYDVLKTYKSIILTGEAIPPSFFSDYSNCNLRNRYGSREFGAIAVGETLEMGYFSDRFVLESDPDIGLLVTDLEKRCMPMLRYPIGDFPSAAADFVTFQRNLTVGGATLGALGPIVGRVFDVLQGCSGKKYVGTFWTIYLKKLGVEKFRLLETEPGSLRLKYVGPIEEQTIIEMLDPDIRADFCWSAERVDEIPELRNAKQKIVEKLYA